MTNTNDSFLDRFSRVNSLGAKMVADFRLAGAANRESSERSRLRYLLAKAGAEHGTDYHRDMTSAELTAVADDYGIEV